MATYNLSPLGNEWTFFGAAGANFPPNLPLNGGFLNTFQAGTATPIATFSNNLGSVQNSTTMQLGPDGRFAGAIWLLSGQGYKFQLTDSTGFQIWVIDNVLGINDSSQITSSEWIASGATPTFSNSTTFTTPGNTTATFTVGRRVKATVTAGTVYGYIFSSTFGVSTTVVLTMDGAQVLDNGLNAVSVGLLNATNPSVPLFAVIGKGEATNTAASAGFVGEYVTATGSSTGLTLGTASNGTSISLTAGDWDVWGTGVFIWTTGPQGAFFQAGVNTVSATLPSTPATALVVASTAALPASSSNVLTTPVQQLLLSATTTVYLVIVTNNTSVTATNGYGAIFARRRR